MFLVSCRLFAKLKQTDGQNMISSDRFSYILNYMF